MSGHRFPYMPYQEFKWPRQEERQAAGEPSSQKRQGGESFEPDRKRENPMPRKGPGALSGRGKSDEGKARASPSDGPRYPISHDYTLRMRFECPFYKQCPTRYFRCMGKCMSRLSDVTTHIKRKHLLSPVVMALGANIESGDLTCYCSRCRDQFVGFGGEGRLRSHCTQEPRCQVATIEQTGVMTLEEFEDLKRRLSPQNTEVTKWFIIWHKCFPRTPRPLSPYVEITVPRSQFAQVLVTEFGSSLFGSCMTRDELTAIVNQSLDRISNGSSTAPVPQIMASAGLQAQHQPVPQQPSNMFPIQTNAAQAPDISCLPITCQSFQHHGEVTRSENFGMLALDPFLTSNSVVQPGFSPGEALYEGDWDLDGNLVPWDTRYESGHYE